jgi:dTDP-4-dehydrorhamnose reductase
MSADRTHAAPVAALLGASGVLGIALAETLGPRAAVRTYLTRPTPGAVRFDATTSSLSELLGRIDPQPEVALILLGITNIDACARDPAGTAKINVAGVMGVVRDCTVLGIKPVFISSDGVFDGSRAYWSEDDEPQPILTYGRQKVAVENFMAALRSPWLVVRIPKLLSPMLEDWIRALGSSAPVECAIDQYFTPMRASDAARAIVALIDQGASGLHHVTGPERISRCELLQALADEYRKHADTHAPLLPRSMREIETSKNLREPRPLDTSMRSVRSARLSVAEHPSSVARSLVRRHFSADR